MTRFDREGMPVFTEQIVMLEEKTIPPDKPSPKPTGQVEAILPIKSVKIKFG
jgi:hypothetical protein